MTYAPLRIRATVIGAGLIATPPSRRVQSDERIRARLKSLQPLAGEFGPADARETLDDAVDVALRDQEDAGVDIVSDGEMRRLGPFATDFYGRMTGLREGPSDRHFGPPSHDQRERFEVIESI